MTDHVSPIKIRDSTLDGIAIAGQVQQQVAQRRAKGLYGPDPANLGPETLRPDRYESAEDLEMADFPGLRESLADLIAEAHLREPDFDSAVPFLGRLVVAVRRLWNWMSTKWYVLPILQQQSEVNARTARVISDLAQWHELDARRLQRLEARIAELEDRLQVGEES